MNQNNQIPRKDGRAQPRIEESDEENMNYVDIALNKKGMPTTNSASEKDSPQDIDHPDDNEHDPEKKPTEFQFPGDEKFPLSEGGDLIEEVQVGDPDEE